VIVAEVRADVATARLIGIDGRERDRRTVGVTTGLAPLGAAVRELLRPPSPTPWYQTKWAYAGGAAAIAAAIAIPLTFIFARNTTPTGVTVRPTGPNGL
jgi:hypothetical protein